eukprot:CAMPEP_0206483416 /NCGR_PEP_ID=MMETSP0324_2-20121206/39412_1 /ASSEMBLY_ACC=CAM_ASM_000836 /TAXON_ID=2866 /ORGANISM="Crypthecodinium cohnii, Strain Seligo" /LENGTH=82 /DNA_ID=CAMNT_0053961461 /DNA_START=288 /DNA_END=536 /DNA_ORIENTATION=-
MNVCQSVCQRILLCVCVFGHEEQPGTEARCNPFPWLAEVDVTVWACPSLPCPPFLYILPRNNKGGGGGGRGRGDSAQDRSLH